jgi:LCP family protein required for cell wall assembly
MSRLRSWISRHRLLSVVLTLTALLMGYLGYHGIRTYVAWRQLDRVAFDIPASRRALAEVTTTTLPGASTIPVLPIDPLADDSVVVYLVIGSDERPEPIPGFTQGTIYADAILLYLAPAEGNPAMVSLPRDLLVTSPCTGGVAKLSTMFTGCGSTVSGQELLAIAVEDFTGVAIDHFAIVRFDAVIDVIDGLGGIELCVPRALQDAPGQDLLPAGCSRVDGNTTLRYVQSRTTLELVDGEWRAIAGVSDLTRAQRQQDVLLALLARAKTVRTPAALADLVASLDDGAIVLDDTLSMSGAIGLAWDLRSTPPATIRRIVLPVEPTVTSDGSYAVIATATLREVLAAS